MALSKAQKTVRAQKKIDEARALLAAAEAEGAEAGLVTAPFVGGETRKHTSTVWIGCKLPKGIVLRLFDQVTVDKPTFGGGVKPTKMFMPVPGSEVRLKGYAVPFGMMPNYPIIGDFGLTEVSRDFWEKFVAQNPKFEMLVNGLIFAHGEEASARAYAKEHEELKCGLEPLAQTGDPRTKGDQPNSPNLDDVKLYDPKDKAA